MARGPCISLIEVDRMGFAHRLAVEFDRRFRQRVGNGLARLAGDDVVPDFSQIGVFPEIGLEGLCLRHAILSRSAVSAALRNLLYSIINLTSRKIKPPGTQDGKTKTARHR